MAIIDIQNYIYCPAAIFDLHGRAYTYANKDEGVPCRIKVGPRRFLNERVYPDQLKLVLWQDQDGQVTYLPNEPVDATTDENGVLFIDAVVLAKKYFGDNISYCDKDHWRWNKNRPFSDTFLDTDHGLATSRSVWLDINLTHSGLYLTPGTLTLCGHDVLNIFWSSFEDECGAHSATMRPLVESALEEPHTLTAEDFLKKLDDLEIIQEYGIHHLSIRTDRGHYRIDSSLNPYIAASLKADPTEIDRYRPSRRCRPLEQVAILLEMMQANSVEEINSTLKGFHQLGLVSKRS